MNTYAEVIDWMFNRLPMYQKQGKSAFKGKLDNIIAFSEHLNFPERQFKSVHVAGTNGKGSTSHMIASVLQESGYKTGLYTSPHLKDFRERIRINGETISEQAVIDFIRTNKSFIETHQLSFFEMTVALSFYHFATEKVDIAVIETGLGGRLDSTNIITPVLSVITNIGFDHTDVLGDTLAKIAGEKAGIIKKGVPVVIGEYHMETYPVFKYKAQEQKATIIEAYNLAEINYKTDLKGNYQTKNVKTAVAALKNLKGFKIAEESLRKGLENVIKNTGLLGRWQQLSKNPLVICDVAHNKEGIVLAMKQVQDYDFNKLHIVFGVVKDKKLAEILPLLPKTATYYFCKPNLARGLEAETLQAKAKEYDLAGNIYSSVSIAYKAAFNKALVNDFVYIGGSTFTVAEII